MLVDPNGELSLEDVALDMFLVAIDSHFCFGCPATHWIAMDNVPTADVSCARTKSTIQTRTVRRVGNE